MLPEPTTGDSKTRNPGFGNPHAQRGRPGLRICTACVALCAEILAERRE